MTQDEALALWDYRDGHLYWREARGRVKAGAKAGSPKRCNGGNEYWRVRCDGKLLLVHRLIFLMHRGYLPEEIDHIDGDGLNNDIENLRPCSRAQNQRNIGIGKSNSSGFKGVTWAKPSRMWKGQIKSEGRTYYLGLFETPQSAHEAYKAAATKLHKEFARFA